MPESSPSMRVDPMFVRLRRGGSGAAQIHRPETARLNAVNLPASLELSLTRGIDLKRARFQWSPRHHVPSDDSGGFGERWEQHHAALQHSQAGAFCRLLFEKLKAELISEAAICLGKDSFHDGRGAHLTSRIGATNLLDSSADKISVALGQDWRMELACVPREFPTEGSAAQNGPAAANGTDSACMARLCELGLARAAGVLFQRGLHCLSSELDGISSSALTPLRRLVEHVLVRERLIDAVSAVTADLRLSLRWDAVAYYEPFRSHATLQRESPHLLSLEVTIDGASLFLGSDPRCTSVDRVVACATMQSSSL